MKRTLIFPALLIAAACGGRNESQTGTTAGASPGTAPGYTTGGQTAATGSGSAVANPITAEVVAVDPAGSNVTLRETGRLTDTSAPATAGGAAATSSAAERTIRVEPSGAGLLGSLKPGDRVTVACAGPASASTLGTRTGDTPTAAGMGTGGGAAAGTGTSLGAPAAGGGSGVSTLSECNTIASLNRQ